MIDLNKITEMKNVKVNEENYWLISLMYGDAAEDKTATFQIPNNIEFTGKPNCA